MFAGTNLTTLTTTNNFISAPQSLQTVAHNTHLVQHCLLYDFYSVFSKGQSIAQNAPGNAIRLEGALLLSKRYKAAIKRAIKMLEQSENNEGQTQTSIQHLGEILCTAELLWSLIEAVSIRPTHNLIAIDLLEWSRECFPSTQAQIPTVQIDQSNGEKNNFLGLIVEELLHQDQPELNDAYWNAVLRQALCADLPSVSMLLQFHSEYKRLEALDKMVKILQTANSSLFKHDRSNCEEFLALQKKVRDLISQKQLFRAHDNLGVICSLLIGDRGTFKKYFELFRPNWFEVLPAFMLYFYPTASGEQMSKAIENMFSLLGLNRHQLSNMEQTILQILELDFIQALKIICSSGQSMCWFATHLVDLLHFHDPTFFDPGSSIATFSMQSTKLLLLNEPGKELAELDLHSRLLIEYAQLLFNDNQLWEIAADYLMASRVQNANELLDRLVIQCNWHENIAVAERLLDICEKWMLQTAREDILRAVTMKYWRQAEWSSALSWALRLQSCGGGNELVAQVARRILQGSIPAERIGQMRVFESLADQFVDCAELVLLYKFYTFKQHLLEGELRPAVQLLHELFLDNSSPTEFHVVLSEEMIRILATFQRPLVGADIVEQNGQIPGLDRESVQNMFRALSMFQLQQNLLKSAAVTSDSEQQKHTRRSVLQMATAAASTTNKSQTKPATTTAQLPSMEVYERLADLMQTLRPMLAEALAASSLQ